MSKGGGGGGGVPTGCYKCGRPGHWSRDCPSSAPSNPNPNPNPNSNSLKNNKSGSESSSSSRFQPQPQPPKSKSSSEKPKKVPKTRPKLTPDILLSDHGLGYILRHFPPNFKYTGRAHEVSDLRNLLRMYADWHSQLLPYFPFDQFVHKVEEVASSRRVRMCIGELKERVANGGDPTKLKESAVENEAVHDKEDIFAYEEPTQPTCQEEVMAFNDNGSEDMQEDILNELYNKTVEEESNPVKAKTAGVVPPNEELEKNSDPVQVTQEQKALMEAKRLKALERAAARSRLLSAS